MYGPFQLREIFHLEFLRWFVRKVKPQYYALKGGVNMRFFFNSLRYSEDIDLDIKEIPVSSLKDIVMEILQSLSFCDNLKVFRIEKIIPPDIAKAKQTQTTQRFKVHLITSSQEDLFTKIEFSRRGLKEGVVVETVSNIILREYKLSPLLVAHYNIQSAVVQKVNAIVSRAAIQARDIFDLYILSSQYAPAKEEKKQINGSTLKRFRDNILEVSFEQFRDTVISYLPFEEQNLYNSSSLWDDIRLKAVNFIEEIGKKNG